MPHVINAGCVDVMHGGCREVCPVGAIHGEAGSDRMLYVDPNECIDCRGCIAECPAGAIGPDAELSADQAVWVDVNRLWFEARPAARAMVEELAARG